MQLAGSQASLLSHPSVAEVTAEDLRVGDREETDDDDEVVETDPTKRYCR